MLSIIIPALNEYDYLFRTLASIYLHTKLSFEVIVIDDASTELMQTSSFCKFDNLIIHRNKSREGLIRSRITGVGYAKGEHLVFMDAHCKPEAGWDICLIRASVKFNERAILTPVIPTLDTESWNNHPHQMGRTMTFNANMNMQWLENEIVDENNYSETAIFGGSTFLISKSFYRELGGFDGGLLLWGGENIDLSISCWTFGGKVIVVNSSVVGHLFKTGFAYPLGSGIIKTNKLRVAYTNFSPDRFKRISKRLRMEKYEIENAAGFWETAEKRKQFLCNNRVYDDEWYLDKFSIVI